MEKLVVKWSFWIGSLCAVLAVIARGLDILGINTLNFSTRGSEIGYHTFMDGTFFFYLISIAVATYARFNSTRQLPPSAESK
ncbi:MAG TPA: hypothetical protein VFE02_03015 [Candidatus Acidoferrales bacterium]|jgi:hypothetical protein|nr:hypothetical protein [Candidatus Acidoferrales bacterium]